MDVNDYADRLAEVATDLVIRVRDDNPDANLRWLMATLTERERLDLLFVLAAAVPDNQPWLTLTAWTTRPQAGPLPCGTPAAAKRHRDHGEPVCGPCSEAERDNWRIRKRDQRARREQAGRAA